MNFSSMEYFIAIAQERSFTKAADRLHVTQQSLSSHIAGMEKELGCKLLVRSVPLELTYAGEVMLRYATNFQKEYTTMEREFCDISENQKGVLCVGAASTRGRVVLPDIIRVFQLEFPNIRVKLFENSNDGLHQMLLENDIDIAIADFSKKLPGIALHDFYEEEIVLAIPRDLLDSHFGKDAQKIEKLVAAGKFDSLADFPFVLGGPDDVDGRVARIVLSRAGIESPVVRVTSHNVGTLLTLCSHSVGACFCPENLIHATMSAQELEKMLIVHLGDAAKYRIRFGYKKDSYQWGIIEAFMNAAKGL